jgi:hypothetical protein
MRLWSVHPKYLDAKGITALWREALLAQRVLRGETSAYAHHPQMERFYAHPHSLRAIATYLEGVYTDSLRRDYHFNRALMGRGRTSQLIALPSGQLDYEFQYLLAKLKRRAPALYKELRSITRPEPHPFFVLRQGPIASWERPKELE